MENESGLQSLAHEEWLHEQTMFFEENEEIIINSIDFDKIMQSLLAS